MKAWMTLLALLLVATPVQAAEMDKPRLRQLADLPTISASLGFGFSTIYGFSFREEKFDPLPAIARIRKELKNDASDAERYMLLGRLYTKAERKEEADKVIAKAVVLYRQQVKEHPGEMRQLAQLGAALSYSGEIKEGETLLRRAVKEAPKEWRAWLALGECLDSQAGRAILGDKRFHFHVFGEKVMADLFAKKPTKEQIAEWHRLQQEARPCYDRAIELAPRETKPYFGRLRSRFLCEMIEAGLRAVEGERIDMMAAFLKPAYAADMVRIARLSPNDPNALGSAMIWELLIYFLHNKNGTGGKIDSSAAPHSAKDPSLMDFLPEASRDFVRWTLEQLEQLTKNTDLNMAADASEILAYALLMIHAPAIGASAELRESLRKSAKKPLPKIVEHLRRAVRLDPTRERAWDFLTTLLAEQRDSPEAVDAASQRIKIKDSAHNRFFLAKSYAEQRQFDKAAEQLRAGLSKDENDLNCRLGLAAVLLRRDDAEALRQAGEQIQAVEPRMKRANRKDATHYALLCGLYLALLDRPDQAKGFLQSVLQGDINNPTAAKALAALGDPATSADEPLAIAYLRSRKAKIERADKRSDSPVVKIRLSGDEIADHDLFFLSAFPQLRELIVHDCAITDAGLTHLHGLKRLKYIHLDKTEVTDKGVAELRKVFPKLDIAR